MLKLDLNSLEEKRKKILPLYITYIFLLNFFFFGTAGLFIYITFLAITNPYDTSAVTFTIILSIALLTLLSIIFSEILSRKIDKFRQFVINSVSDDVIKFVYPENQVTFSQNEGLSLEAILNSHFFVTCSFLKSENLISGTYKDCAFLMSDFYLNRQHLKSYPMSEFKGQMIILEFNEPIVNGSLKIMRKRHKTIRKEITLNKIEIQDIDFQKKFNVYGTDTNKLTNNLLHELLKFEKSIKSSFYISITNKTCYIAILNSKNFFYISLIKPFNKSLLEKVSTKFLFPKHFIDIFISKNEKH
jgi:hypothetical protein